MKRTRRQSHQLNQRGIADLHGAEIEDPAVIKPATTTQMSGAHERPAGSALSIANLLRGAVRDSDGQPFAPEEPGARSSYLGEQAEKADRSALAEAIAVGTEKYQDLIAQVKRMEAAGNPAALAARAAIPKRTAKAAAKHVARRAVREEGNGNFYYDNDATSVEQIEQASKQPPLPRSQGGSTPVTPKPVHNRLVAWWQSVNPDAVSKVIDDNGEPANPDIRYSAMRGLPLFSRQADVANSIARGQAAMDRVIRTRGDEMEAMERGGLGKIAFLWGNAGRLDARKGRYVEGGGVAHIIAQRNLEGEDGEATARAMPDVMALGDVRPRLRSPRWEASQHTPPGQDSGAVSISLWTRAGVVAHGMGGRTR